MYFTISSNIWIGSGLRRVSIDGFFEDKAHTESIKLNFSCDVFQTNILSAEKPDNPEADAIRLKEFLEKFTLDAYVGVVQTLAAYSFCYTSDPLHMK